MKSEIEKVREVIILARLGDYQFYPVKAELHDGIVWFLGKDGNTCGCIHPEDWENFPSDKNKYVWADSLAD